MENIKIKLSEKYLIEIWNDQDGEIFFDDLFDDCVTLISNNDKRYNEHYRNLGPKKSLKYYQFFNEENEENEENEDTIKITFDGLQNYWHCFFSRNRELLSFDGIVKTGEKIHLSDYSENYEGLLILDCKKLGIDLNEVEAENFFKSFIRNYNCIQENEVYGFTLYEIETCNLGHEHLNEADSCGGFYGYENESKMILEMLNHCIKKEEITLKENLKKHLTKDDYSSLLLSELFTE